MKQFTYKARDKNGNTVGGTVEALSEALAVRVLQEKGLLVVSVAEKRSLSFKGLQFNRGHVSDQEVAIFTRLMASMLKAGLPLVDSLANLQVQVKNTTFKTVIASLLHDVQGGSSISEAMARFPGTFSHLYISLIKAGEVSGKADETMERLAEMMEADLDFKGKVKGAMIYPAIVVVAMTAVGLFMVTSIIPKIADVYKEMGATLPLPTLVLLAISDLVRNYFIIVIIIVAALYFAFKTLRKNPAADLLINNFMLKIPIFGNLQNDVTLTLITRTLGTLVNSGVAILDSLKIVGNTLANNYFKIGLNAAAAAVEKGLPLSDSLKRDPNFPVMVAQLVAIGEETGTLGDSLLRLSKFYQESTERKVKGLTTALEPLMIILMGGMVGGLAVAVLLPMFNLVNVIK